MFERLRAAIEAALEGATPPRDAGEVARDMHDAVVEARVSVGKMREARAGLDKELAIERKQKDDAERRGQMAEEIGDAGTVEVARRFAAKHGERVAVLEKKLEVERAELHLAERELGEMTEQLRRYVQDRSGTAASESIESAWRDLQAAGGVRPETDLEDELLRSRLDRDAREAVAEERLRDLKKKMGK